MITLKRTKSPARADDSQSEPRTVRARLRGIAREWLLPLIVVLAILTPVRSVIADWHDVPTGSMEPTILPGDRIMVNKLSYGLRVPFTSRWIATWDAPARGEICVMHSPADGTRLVKRVIGVPGDVVSMINNRIYVNGAPLDVGELTRAEIDALDASVRSVGGRTWMTERLGGREHLIQITPGKGVPRSFAPITVPASMYLVMGDNRDESADSRTFGFVPFESFRGRAFAVAFSLDRQGWWLPRTSRFFRDLD